MPRIIGAKIQENVEYEIENEKTGEKTTGVINKVEFRCIVKDIGADRIGGDVARYSVSIEDLPYVFGVQSVGNSVTEFCKKVIDKECLFETRASAFGGKVTERLVGVTFVPEKK